MKVKCVGTKKGTSKAGKPYYVIAYTFDTEGFNGVNAASKFVDESIYNIVKPGFSYDLMVRNLSFNGVYKEFVFGATEIK